MVRFHFFCFALPDHECVTDATRPTTLEQLRPKDVRSGAIDPSSGKTLGNLYALRSPMDNIVSLLCRPIAVESWVKPWGFATRDERYAGGTFEKEES